MGGLGESGLLEGRGVAVANLAQLHPLAPQTAPETLALVHRDADEPRAQALVEGACSLGIATSSVPCSALAVTAATVAGIAPGIRIAITFEPRRRLLVRF